MNKEKLFESLYCRNVVVDVDYCNNIVCRFPLFVGTIQGGMLTDGNICFSIDWDNANISMEDDDYVVETDDCIITISVMI